MDSKSFTFKLPGEGRCDNHINYNLGKMEMSSGEHVQSEYHHLQAVVSRMEKQRSSTTATYDSDEYESTQPLKSQHGFLTDPQVADVEENDPFGSGLDLNDCLPSKLLNDSWLLSCSGSDGDISGRLDNVSSSQSPEFWMRSGFSPPENMDFYDAYQHGFSSSVSGSLLSKLTEYSRFYQPCSQHRKSQSEWCLYQPSSFVMQSMTKDFSGSKEKDIDSNTLVLNNGTNSLYSNQRRASAQAAIPAQMQHSGSSGNLTDSLPTAQFPNSGSSANLLNASDPVQTLMPEIGRTFLRRRRPVADKTSPVEASVSPVSTSNDTISRSEGDLLSSPKSPVSPQVSDILAMAQQQAASLQQAVHKSNHQLNTNSRTPTSQSSSRHVSNSLSRSLNTGTVPSSNAVRQQSYSNLLQSSGIPTRSMGNIAKPRSRLPIIARQGAPERNASPGSQRKLSGVRMNDV